MKKLNTDSMAGHFNASANAARKVDQEVTQKVKHTTQPNTLHFSIFKKLNTFYLRVLHYTGNPKRRSVTVSLRTSHRYRAVGNADLLKQRLIEGIGRYNDFEDIRMAAQSIARTELTTERERYNWFVRDLRHRNSPYLFLQHNGEQPPHSEPQTEDQVTNSPKGRSNSTLITLIELFIEDKIASSSWKPSTEYCRKASFSTLEKFIRKIGLHARPLCEIKRNDLINVRQSMLDDGFKPSTVNLRMGDFISLFEFAEINELINKSPAIKLKIRENSPISKKEKAKSIPPETIPALLKHINEYAESRRVQKHHTPYLGWIAIVAAITGCRIAELTQLRKADVKQTEAGHWYISIHEEFEGNSVKNSSSIRDVPLINGAYGFNLSKFLSEVVNTLENHKDYLFRTTGKARNTLSNWFSLAMKQFKCNRSNIISFHSFRHSLSTLCLNKGMPEAFTKLILGHSGGTITYGLYGAAGVSIDVLHDEIAKKVFDKAVLNSE